MSLLAVSHYKPEFEQAPRAVPLDTFLLGWLEHDYRYAVLKPASAT
jgi:hypothetical protein